MLSSEDHPGIFTFLVGMIVVVMTAVGLSIVADKHRIHAGGTGDLQHEVSTNATVISELTAQTAEQGQILENNGSQLHRSSLAHRELSAKLETFRQRQAMLEKSKVQAGAVIAALEESFSRYRADYRRKEWEGAIGESLGTLTIRGGRAFQQTSITRVTDVGLEIRHEHGIARIQAPDLDLKLQDRFQWSDEERRSRLAKEREDREGKPEKTVAAEPEVVESGEAVTETIPVPPALPVSRILKSKPDVDPEKLMLARLQVTGWRAKVSRLRIDRAEASSRAGYGKASVPGSLETWVARSARLGRDLFQAQATLAAAQADLATLAPNDPLLRVLEPGQ